MAYGMAGMRGKLKVVLCGHFGFGYEMLNGQTVKTKMLARALAERIGENAIAHIDTHGRFRALFLVPFQLLMSITRANNIIIMPAHKGVNLYGRILPMLHRLFPQRKIHYVVIGGWLPQYLKNRTYLSRALKKFDGIYVETSIMKKSLEQQGFQNIHILKNFKDIERLPEDNLVYQSVSPYRLCTFSRVMKEKGIEDAIEAVRRINESSNRVEYTLDIYGQIDVSQGKWFSELQDAFPDYVRYCGTVPPEDSVRVLKNYFALLFPTRFFTEGVPGTIIDAYASGVPVISARWQSCEDIVKPGITGVVYNFLDVEDLIVKLEEILEYPDKFSAMKRNCLNASEEYSQQSAIDVIIDQLA